MEILPIPIRKNSASFAVTDDCISAAFQAGHEVGLDFGVDGHDAVSPRRCFQTVASSRRPPDGRRSGSTAKAPIPGSRYSRVAVQACPVALFYLPSSSSIFSFTHCVLVCPLDLSFFSRAINFSFATDTLSWPTDSRRFRKYSDLLSGGKLSPPVLATLYRCS